MSTNTLPVHAAGGNAQPGTHAMPGAIPNAMPNVMPNALRVRLHGIGVLAPGFAGWDACAACLRGQAPYHAEATVLPAPEMLPPAERRRASRVIKLALAIGAEAVQHAGMDAAQLATVFTSSTGDGHNCHALCEVLASEQRDISPTRFHNSVHNTAAGYWCIATGATGPCQVLAAYDASFAAGLLEAAVQAHTEQRPVLLLAYDSDYPQPLHACRPVPDVAGVALVLAPANGAAHVAQHGAAAPVLAELGISWQAAAAAASEPATGDVLDGADAASRLPAGLQILCQSIPAMRALPLLRQLACAQAGVVALEGLPGQTLRIEVQPCA